VLDISAILPLKASSLASGGPRQDARVTQRRHTAIR